jgi:hypothetical protein
MFSMLITALITILLFALVAFGLKWACDNFFPGFRPAYWICGVVLIVLLLIAASYVFSNGGTLHFPR